MKLLYAHLCDQAFLSLQGKMNLIGLFDHIGMAYFPSTHHKCDLALSWELTDPDLNKPIDIEIKLVDEDGQAVMASKIQHKIGGPAPRWRVMVPLIITLKDMPFNAPGDYEIHVFVQGSLEATVPITVTQNPIEQSDSIFS